MFWWNMCPALLNPRLRLNAFKLVTVILRYLRTDEKTCAARQDLKSNCSEKLLELFSFTCLYI